MRENTNVSNVLWFLLKSDELTWSYCWEHLLERKIFETKEGFPRTTMLRSFAERFARDGYAVIPNFFSREEIQSIKRRAQEVFFISFFLFVCLLRFFSSSSVTKTRSALVRACFRQSCSSASRPRTSISCLQAAKSDFSWKRVTTPLSTRLGTACTTGMTCFPSFVTRARTERFAKCSALRILAFVKPCIF